jgi:hypothetical protein
MKREKNNLIIDKNLKKKIVVIGVVFFIISVVFNINLDNFFTQEYLEKNEKEEPEIIPIQKQSPEIVEKIVNQVYEDMLSRHIQKLTQPGPHPTATLINYILSNRPIIGKFIDLPIEEVRDYICTELKNMDVRVDIIPWRQYIFPRFYVGNIIEATFPGTNESSNEIFILVANYDTKPLSRGANDACSGVAACLTAADVIRSIPLEHTIKILFVDGGKQGLIGSRKYVEEAKKNNDNIVGVICIDNIGIPGPDYRGDEVLITFKKTSIIADHMGDVNDRYLGIFNFRIHLGDSGDHGSDHKSFLEQGYEAICISGAGNENDNWLKISDTIENIDLSYVTKVTKFVIANICELSLDFR